MFRFRKYKFVFLADTDQRKLLRILWTLDGRPPIEVYELNTATYETSYAPFLDTRVLKQLALDEIEKFSQASEVLLNDCYMDDIISGADSLETAKELQTQIIQLLESARMRLHKWKSNHPALLENVINNNIGGYSFLEKETKAIGVTWKPNLDVFTFKVKIDQPERLSRRTVLSDITRVFDPLDLIGTVTTKAKIYIQEYMEVRLGRSSFR